jgi:hypothetical protein
MEESGQPYISAAFPPGKNLRYLPTGGPVDPMVVLGVLKANKKYTLLPGFETWITHPVA